MATNSITYLKKIMPTLSPVCKKIATYFIEHEDTLCTTPILTIAESCGTTKSAVVRLCKHLGYAGYKDFLTGLSAQLAVSPAHAVNDIRPGMDSAEVCRVVVSNTVFALQSTQHLLDPAAVEKATEKIWGADKLFLFGYGESGIVASDAALKFRRIGLNADSADTLDTQLILLSSAGEKDAVIFFSYSGATRDIFTALTVAMQRGVTVIAVTCMGRRNPLAQKADIVLITARSETYSRSGAMTSRTTMLSIVDILFTHVVSAHWKDVEETLTRSNTYLSRLKLKP